MILLCHKSFIKRYQNTHYRVYLIVNTEYIIPILLIQTLNNTLPILPSIVAGSRVEKSRVLMSQNYPFCTTDD